MTEDDYETSIEALRQHNFIIDPKGTGESVVDVQKFTWVLFHYARLKFFGCLPTGD